MLWKKFMLEIVLLLRIDVPRALGPFTFTPLDTSCIQLRDYVYNLFDACTLCRQYCKISSCCKITMRSVQICPQNSKHILKTSSLQGIPTWSSICICWVPFSKTHNVGTWNHWTSYTRLQQCSRGIPNLYMDLDSFQQFAAQCTLSAR